MQQKDSNLIYGQMQDIQQNTSQIIEFGAKYYGDQEIVTRTIEGPIHRYTFAEATLRSKKLTQALQKYGIKISDRIGTVASNTYRHFECYYGIQSMGAILNTVNPRLHPDQFTYIMNHAQNRLLFIDLPFLPLVEKLISTFKTLEKVVILTDAAHMPKSSAIQDKLLCYEELIADFDGNMFWPELDERLACCLCYTSGTTGNPKGVLYSHRSTVWHAMRLMASFCLPMFQKDVVLPVVPMFHVNAWGLVYAAPMTGFKLVFPGLKMDGASIYELVDSEAVTFAFGVPTVWNMLLKYCEDNGKVLSKLRSTVIGGAAVPISMIEAFWEKHDVEVIQGWGMTELSPVGCVTKFDSQEDKLTIKDKQKLIQKAGKAIFGTDMKLISDDGKEVPMDGKSTGHLAVRGINVVGSYYNDDRKESFLEGGWFATGDVATLDKKGWMTITDRSKDVIKTGGEWVSSIDLENAAQGHPKVFEAAVIGLPHPKWDERPLLIVVKNKKDEELSYDEMKEFLSDKVHKTWIPNDMVFVDEIPKQATGKIWKIKLKEQFKEFKFSR